MALQLNFEKVLLTFGILFIGGALCYPVAASDDFLSLGVNYLTKTAKSASPSLGSNRLLFPFSDLQSRTRNLHNSEGNNNIQSLVNRVLHPWQINKYNIDKTKDINYEESYKTNEVPTNSQWKTLNEQNNGTLLSVTPKNSIVSNNQATELSVNYDNKLISNSDLITKYGSESSINTEATTELVTESGETTTEGEMEDLSNRLAVPPQVVASLLG